MNILNVLATGEERLNFSLIGQKNPKQIFEEIACLENDSCALITYKEYAIFVKDTFLLK